jgi:hypothetical protein
MLRHIPKPEHEKAMNPNCENPHPSFSLWMAGGGIKPGISYGGTDELRCNAVTDVVHVHDFHATIMKLLGIDHKRLTFKFQGRDYRLTDVFGNVVEKILI